MRRGQCGETAEKPWVVAGGLLLIRITNVTEARYRWGSVREIVP
jgi:hypothetical protein